ncbi:hypothetical protein [Sphingobium sp.]|uniref:hypothetical protein n=1 Tax=Sphingobium sp. TaxID=1912891 RepID=UPI002CD7E3EF|nr:hypothetical protein [Sphingobium sp.]HUD93420.1 hypothetical protein [Sphingobium sp.]
MNERPTYMCIMNWSHFKTGIKSFGRGFGEGFSAHWSFFDEASFPRANSVDVSIRTAWRSVGDALHNAESVERGNIDKRTGKFVKKDRAAID